MTQLLLTGNGSYRNRGCEAIVRGTHSILASVLPDAQLHVASRFDNDIDYREQCLVDQAFGIRHYKIDSPRRYSPAWYAVNGIDRLFPGTRTKWIYRSALNVATIAAAVLCIGGDNYSLDYGVPRLFTDFDTHQMRMGKPLFLWGASVGPFSAQPDVERAMADHLRNFRVIFARESKTVEYLESIGVSTNVMRVADPAFMMAPAVPQGLESRPFFGSIGINLSPLIGRYAPLAKGGEWLDLAVDITERAATVFDNKLVLVPHVFNATSNDGAFLRLVFERLSPAARRKTILLDERFSAAEFKGAIAQLSAFVGARTHATIAALSSNVPTISIGYSLKSEGICSDIFGDQKSKYWIPAQQLSTDAVLERIADCLNNRAEISQHLANANLTHRTLAKSAAGVLMEHLSNG